MKDFVELTGRHLASRPDGESIVLLGLEDNQYYTLEGVAAFVWERLETGRASLEELAAAVSEEFAVENDQAVADIRAFMTDLKDVGLIRAVEG